MQTTCELVSRVKHFAFEYMSQWRNTHNSFKWSDLLTSTNLRKSKSVSVSIARKSIGGAERTKDQMKISTDVKDVKNEVMAGSRQEK